MIYHNEAPITYVYDLFEKQTKYNFVLPLTNKINQKNIKLYIIDLLIPIIANDILDGGIYLPSIKIKFNKDIVIIKGCDINLYNIEVRNKKLKKLIKY